MNFKTTIVLLIALICVGAFVLLTRDKGTEETPKATAHKLVDLSPSDLSKVKITTSDGKTTALERVDNKWRLTEPVNAPADAFEVDSVLSGITGLTATNEVPTSGSNAPQTGLDQPQYKIELSTATKPTTLLVGNRLAISDSVYVQVAGQKEADVVSASFLDKLDNVANTVRDKKLVETPSNEIEQLVLTRPQGRIALQKKDGKWEMTEPMAVPADAAAMSSFLGALSNLKAVDFDDAHARSTGLNAPMLTVFYSTTAPSTQPAAPATASTAGVLDKAAPVSETIRFGDYADAMQKNVFVQAASGAASASVPAAVARVSAESLKSLNQTALDLRDRDVLSINPAEVNKFSVKTETPATTQPTTKPAESTVIAIAHRATPLLPGTHPTTHPTVQPFNLHETPATPWAFVSDKPADASSVDVNELLGAMHPLKAEKFLEKPEAEKPVANYVVSVTTIGPGGAPVTDYTIDIADPGHDLPLQARYNGLAFELPRSLLKTVTADFVDRPGKVASPPSMREPSHEPIDIEPPGR